MKKWIFISASVLLEGVSWWVTVAQRGRLALLLFLLTHGAAGVFGALGLISTLPKHLRTGRLHELMLMGAPQLLIPFVGIPAMLVYALSHVTGTRELARGPAFRTTAIPELPASAAPAGRPSVFADFNLAAALRHGREPARRLRAVLAAGRMRDPAGVAILTLGLKDRDDEVRLLSYALLDSKEREIYTRIKEDTARMVGAPPDVKARLDAWLAQHHWEMVYMGLASGEVAKHHLAEARHHAEEALAIAPSDGGSHLLRGRVLMRLGLMEEAQEALLRARECGIADGVVLPYLADICFKRRRFSEVREYVRALGTHGNLPPRVRAFWS